jgi:DNA-binding beta-propeller fold protein YncE
LGFVRAALVEVVDGRPNPKEGSPRAYVLDVARRAVGIVEPVTGSTRFATFGVPSPSRSDGTIDSNERNTAARLFRSPDGSRLVVVDIGPGRFDMDSGFQPSRQSTIVVLDAATLKVISRIPGPWGLPIAGFTRDGARLTVAAPGRAQGRSEAVTVDVRKGTVLGRLDLDPYIRGGRHWLQWYLGGAIAPDGEHLYLVDWGQRSTDRARHVDGRIHVVATAALGHVSTLAGGGAPRVLQVDCGGDQVFALSDRPPWAISRDEREAELRILRGREVAATVRVAPWPLFVRVSRNRDLLHVVSEERVMTLDAVSLAEPVRRTVPRPGFTPWQWTTARSARWDPERPFNDFFNRGLSDVVLAPDGRLAFAVHNGSGLSVVDLEEGRRVVTLATEWQTVERMWRPSVPRFFSAYPVGALPALTDLAIRPDGRFVYVLNAVTEVLTIFETSTGRIIGQMPLARMRIGLSTWGIPTQVGLLWSRRPVVVLPDANLLGVESPQALQFIDMRTNSEVLGLRFAGEHNAIALSSDGRRLFVLSRGRLSYLDARTGKFLAALPEFENPTQIVFDAAPNANASCQF